MGERFEVELGDDPPPRRRRRGRGGNEPPRDDGSIPSSLRSGPPVLSGPLLGDPHGDEPEAPAPTSPPPARRGAVVGAVVAGAIVLFGLGWSLGREGGSASAPTGSDGEAPVPASSTPVAATATTDPISTVTLPRATAPTTARPSTTTVPPVAEFDTGRPLLPVQTGIVVVGVSTDGDLVEIEMDTGRYRVTALPRSGPSGPPGVATILTSDDGTLVVLPDAGRAFTVPAGEPARELTGIMTTGWYPGVVPGPEPGTAWVVRADDTELVPSFSLELVGLDGEPLGPGVDIGTWYPIGSDQRGNVLVQAAGGVYEAGLDGVRRVSAGYVVGVGANHRLEVLCAEDLVCERALVDAASGERTVVAADVFEAASWYGLTQFATIAPDGRAAVLPVPSRTGPESVALHELDTGLSTPLLDVPGGFWGWSAAWSRDGRFLLYTDEGRLFMVDRPLRTFAPVDAELPELGSFTIRQSTG